MATGPRGAIENLLSDMQTARDRTPEHDIRCGFGLQIGLLPRIPMLRSDERQGGRWSWETIVRNFLADTDGVNAVRPVKQFKCRESYIYEDTELPNSSGAFLISAFASSMVPNAIFTEFAGHAERAEKSSRLLLKELGHDLIPQPDPKGRYEIDAIGFWFAFLCRLVIDYHADLSYLLRHQFYTDTPSDRQTAIGALVRWNHSGDGSPGSLNWDPFAAELRCEPTLPQGVYLLSPSIDVRSASIEALRLLLRMEPLPQAEPRKSNGAEVGSPNGVPPIGEPPAPRWDKAKKTLFYGKTVCRQFTKIKNSLIVAVLDKFQEGGWPDSIVNPHSQKLPKLLVDSLHEGMSSDSPIRFGYSENLITWSVAASR